MTKLGLPWSVSLLSIVAVACGGSVAPRAKAPELPAESAKCRVAADRENPLVTEWPASEKANLEVRLREGGVAVAEHFHKRELPARIGRLVRARSVRIGDHRLSFYRREA